MTNEDLAAFQQNSHDIEPVGLARAAMPVNPAFGGFGEFPLFSMVDRLHRIAKIVARSRLHLDEHNEFITLHDEIDIAAA